MWQVQQVLVGIGFLFQAEMCENTHAHVSLSVCVTLVDVST